MAKEEKDLDLKAQNSLKKSGDIPRHIAIIMDGNGRWARKRGLPRAAGHKQGVETVRDMVKACVGLGVKYLTLYTFSTENWKRPKDEVTTLMRLIVKSLQNETNELNANNVRLSTIGNRDSLPETVRRELEQAIGITSGNTALTLNLALSYSGRWEILEAAKKIALMVKDNNIQAEDVTESLFSSFLTTRDMPDPDLLIRSGGEFRVSNFLLWQIAYSEFFVTDVLWPEFKRQHLYEAIKDYQKRERRFGLVSEQISRTSKV
ncbi:MAG: isoprenyl transferase [Ignavibacteria bacterium]|nr:isoprenyl transferase [Ignavibacteria bacterium]MCU7504117.1 isoprenyl transferase [Ignavibacteria bacterium]MCU7516433.1 isoprenyl transferase [Ignavibacteria bacterium]